MKKFNFYCKILFCHLRLIKKTALVFLGLLIIGKLNAQTPWYYNGTGPLNNTTSWGTNTDGTGGTLVDFTSGGRYFIIQNTTAVTLTSNWTVGNTNFAAAGGDSVIIGNHTMPVAPITFTIATGAAFTVVKARTVAAAAPLSGNNKIVYQNTTPISFGQIADPALELVYDNTTIVTSTSSSFGNVSLINNAVVDMGGAAILLKNLTIDDGSKLSGPIGSSSNFIGVKAGGIVTINGTFKAGRTGSSSTNSLFTANVAFPITPTSSFATMLFQDMTVTQSTNLILGPNSTIEYYRGTSGQTGTQTVAALNYANLSLSNLSVASNKQFATAGTINVAGTMAINLITGATIATPANSLNILPTGRFVINSATGFGLTAGNQKLFLKSDATGTASIGTMAAGASFFGSINVEKYIPPSFRKHRFFSHPFNTNQPLSELTGEIDVTGNTSGTTGVMGQMAGTGFTSTATNNPSAFYFNTAIANGAMPNDAGWVAFVDNTTTTNWPRGKGIRILIRGPKGQANTLDGTDATPDAVTLTLNGNINVGNVAVPMVNTATGLNLMGNPYASPIDIGAVLTAAMPGTNIGTAFYLRNPQTESYITVSPIPASYIIPAYSAFFVQALTGSNLNFTEANKANCTSCPTVFRTSNTNNHIEIKAFINGLEYDNIIFNINENYKADYNKTEDALKIMNKGFNIYSLTADGKKVAANSLNLMRQNTIPLGINLPKTEGIKTIKFKVTDFLMANNKVTLYDKLLNKYYILNNDVEIDLNIDPNNINSVGENRLLLTIED